VSDPYLFLKWLHVVFSTVLFGTGAGIAFFFVRANRTGDARIIAAVVKEVVFADAVFTAVAVVLQPVTGIALLWIGGLPWTQSWILASLALYVTVGCCWLPVVWLQIRMRNMAVAAASKGSALPEAYRRCYRWWVALGWPAFIGVLVIFYLMIARPALWTA